jgi:PAS domain S-box-containing protein
MKKTTLRQKLIFGLMVLGGLLTLLASSVQLYWTYGQEVAEVENEMRTAEHSALPLLRASLWSLDEGQTRLVLDSMVAMPNVSGARVTGEMIHLTSGQIPEHGADALSREVAIVHVHQGNHHTLGNLELYASLKPVRQKLLEHAGMVLAINTVYTLVVALIAGLFFDQLVMRHVRRVAKYLENTPYISDAPALSLTRSAHHWDELDELSQAVNHLRIKLNLYDKEIREEKSRYYALVENNPEAIWRCELREPVSVTSSVEAQVEALQRHAVLAELNDMAVRPTGCDSRIDILGSPWHLLPFLNADLWQTLVRQHYRLKDWPSQFVDHQGRERFFSNSFTCLISEGQIKAIWGIAVEVTQRVRAQRELESREHQLSLSQARLAEAQALAHMGHWVYRTQDDHLQVSEEFARIFGFDPTAETPLTWEALHKRIHPDDRERLVHTLRDPNTLTVGMEHRVVWPNGEERHVQATARKTVENGTVTSTFGIIMDITERRRAEEERKRSQQALVESEARMAEAQAIAHLGHWILDRSTQLLNCSDEFFRLLGHPPQSFRPTLKNFLQQIHPEDQAHFRDLLAALQDRALAQEFRIVRTDGAVRYLRGTIAPFYSGGRDPGRVFGISMDVTEHKLAELELRASQELFSKAFAASPDAIAFIDLTERTLVDVNHTLAVLTGCRESELVGLPLEQFAARLGNTQLPGLFDSARAEHNIELELRPTGVSPATCLLSWRPVELKGRACILAILRDVTTLRQLQRTTDAQQKQLVRADKLASLGTMVAGVAHEINNPNHLILMNAELLESFSHHLLELLDEYLDDEQRHHQFNGMPLEEILTTLPELLTDIKASSRRIDRIVKDLKDFARPRDNAEFLPLRLNQLIEKARPLLASALDKRHIQLTYELAEDLPEILGDSQRLEQVVVNLVTNALDAVPEQDARIGVRTYRRGEFVACDVTDNGCGIAEEHLAHIFDPFFTTKQEHGGTGLGLSISFRLIREHGGQLEAISSQGKGTTMRILLPVPRAPTDATPETKVAGATEVAHLEPPWHG